MMSRGREFRELVSAFLESYSVKKGMHLRCWLIMELHRHMPDKSAAEIVSNADEIITSLKVFDEKRESLEQSMERGRSKERWFREHCPYDWNFRDESAANRITQCGIITSGDFTSGHREIIRAELLSGQDLGIKAAVSGAELTAANRGIITIPEALSPSVCAGNAYTAIENIKMLQEVSRNKLNVDEAIQRFERVCVSVAAGIAGIKGAYEGGTMGWEIGQAFGFAAGVTGAAVGGIVGGVAGWFGGAEVGEGLIKGAKKLKSYLERFKSAASDQLLRLSTSRESSLANALR